MMTRRFGCANGRPRKNRSWIKLKIAVFMPMPSARVNTASRVKPGDLRSWRIAKRRSVIGIFDLRFWIFLVPKLCLGMTMSWQLCCPGCETEFRGQVRSQTEFGNEDWSDHGLHVHSARRAIIGSTRE